MNECDKCPAPATVRIIDYTTSRPTVENLCGGHYYEEPAEEYIYLGDNRWDRVQNGEGRPRGRPSRTPV